MSGSPAPDNHPPASGREQVVAAFARNRAPVQRQSARDEALATWSSCYRAKAAAVSRADHQVTGTKMSDNPSPRHFRDARRRNNSVAGSLFPDSCHPGWMPMTAALGPGCVKTQSDLVVTPRRARISAFFCFPRDRTPQNSWCAFTVQSFHTAWANNRHPAGTRSGEPRVSSCCSHLDFASRAVNSIFPFP
jgi:hypothetical protein